MITANKKKTTLFVLLAILTFLALYTLTLYSFAIIQLIEFTFTLFSLGGEQWMT